MPVKVYINKLDKCHLDKLTIILKLIPFKKRRKKTKERLGGGSKKKFLRKLLCCE